MIAGIRNRHEFDSILALDEIRFFGWQNVHLGPN